MKKMLLMLFLVVNNNYIFTQTIMKIVPKDNIGSEYFGYSVSISGNYIAVGSPLNLSSKGTVHIFMATKEGLHESQTISLPDGQQEDYFGYAVKIFGNILVASAPGKGNGKVYVFKMGNDYWQKEVILEAEPGYNIFGESLYLTEEYLLVGQASGYNGISYEGMATIFKRTSNTEFQLDGKIFSDEISDYSGTVTLAMYGDAILMGTPDENKEVGAAYYFEKQGTAWEKVYHFIQSPNVWYGYYGGSVAIGEKHLIVGAWGYHSNQGTVYVMDKSGSIVQILDFSSYAEGTNIGYSLDFDGNNLIIGSNPSDPGRLNVGRVFIYKLQNEKFNLINSLISPDSNEFGYSVATDNQNYIIGAWSDMGKRGSAYFYGHLPSAVSVNASKNTPECFLLTQNYPNPFNPATTINYSLPQVSFVSLKVYDLLGKEITTLVNEEKMPGSYEVKFNGTNLASGVYFYRLQARDYLETKKFTLLK